MNLLRRVGSKITVIIAVLTLVLLAALESALPAGATVSGCCRPVGTSDQSMVFTQ